MTNTQLENEHNISITEEKEKSENIQDGGWGWIVVAACFFCNMVNDGIAYSFGILLEPISKNLSISIGKVSLIGGSLAGVTMLVGPLAAISVNRFGSRITCIIGSLIASLAMFLSSYCCSFYSLFLCYGILAGIGLGFLYVPAVVAVGEYFRTKLSLATGICVCGSGAGTFLIAPLISYMLDHSDWRGCIRVMSLLCLACTGFGLLLRKNKISKMNDEHNNNNNNSYKNEVDNNTFTEDQPKPRVWCDVRFLLMSFANIPNAMAIYISYTYLPAMAHQSGLLNSDAHFLISVVGISNTIGRVASGWIADKKWTSPLGITIFTVASASIICSILPSGTHYGSLVILSSIFGAVISSGPTVSTPLIVDLIGIDQLNTAFGILTFARGLAAVIGPSAAGVVLDNFSSQFGLSFYISCFLFSVSAFLHILIWCCSRNLNRRREYMSI